MEWNVTLTNKVTHIGVVEFSKQIDSVINE